MVKHSRALTYLMSLTELVLQFSDLLLQFGLLLGVLLPSQLVLLLFVSDSLLNLVRRIHQMDTGF